MAKGKITLQMLSEMMAANSNQKKAATELFVRNFFSILKDALKRDNIIKIKGFGTFKMVVVNARESVNVNTGERVYISEYNKITFTPDKAFKERINKPFAQFETILLDDTDIQIVENAIGNVESEVNTTYVLPSVVVPEPVVESEPTVMQESIAEPEPTIVPEPVAEIRNIEQFEAEKLSFESKHPKRHYDDDFEEENTHKSKWKYLWILLAVLLIGGAAYYFGSIHLFDTALTSKQAETNSKELLESDTFPSTQPALLGEDEAKLAYETGLDSIKQQKMAAAEFPQIENGNYIIIGIKTYRKIKPNYNIKRYCMQIYGKADAVPYVLLINNLTDADKVSNGNVVKFPELIER